MSTGNLLAKLMLAMMILSAVSPNPLPSNFQCPEAKKALHSFRALTNNATDIPTTLRLSLRYFNVSEIYYEPLYTKIISFCRPMDSTGRRA